LDSGGLGGVGGSGGSGGGKGSSSLQIAGCFSVHNPNATSANASRLNGIAKKMQRFHKEIRQNFVLALAMLHQKLGICRRRVVTGLL